MDASGDVRACAARGVSPDRSARAGTVGVARRDAGPDRQ